MPKRTNAELEQITNLVRADFEQAKDVAASLFGKTPPGMAKVSERKYLEYALENWPDPAFRQHLLASMGAEKFIGMARSLTKYAEERLQSGEGMPESWTPPPPPMEEMMGPEMMMEAPPMEEMGPPPEMMPMEGPPPEMMMPGQEMMG